MNFTLLLKLELKNRILLFQDKFLNSQSRPWKLQIWMKGK